jgi:hypothetical protein
MIFSPHQTPKSLALLTAALVPLANAVAVTPNHIFARDPPAKIPVCATDNDKKWQPAMDFDTDSCYNVPAISGDGTLCPGLDNCYTGNIDGCRDLSDLNNNNVYSRQRCNNGWCAYMYGYYFEKDVGLQHVCGVGAGHRHDWEHIVVWVQGDQAKFVGASAHGNYDVRAAGDIRWDGNTHPKIVYHKDGAGTHAFRFANEDDDNVENDKHAWFYGELIGYFGFPTAEVRDKMLNNDWGDASIDFKDASFSPKLDSAKGGNDIPMDTGKDADGSPGDPVGC